MPADRRRVLARLATRVAFAALAALTGLLAAGAGGLGCRGILGIDPLPGQIGSTDSGSVFDGGRDTTSGSRDAAVSEAATTDASADTVVPSGDASAWTPRPNTGVGTDLYAIWGTPLKNGDLLYAVGADSVILRSVGGVGWSGQAVGLNGEWDDGDAGFIATNFLGVTGLGPNGVLVASGNAGHLLWSTDGMTWSAFANAGYSVTVTCVWLQGSTLYAGIGNTTSAYGIVTLTVPDAGISLPEGNTGNYEPIAIGGAAEADGGLYAVEFDGLGVAHILAAPPAPDGGWTDQASFDYDMSTFTPVGAGIWGSGAGDVYVVSGGLNDVTIVEHWSSATNAWEAEAVPPGMGWGHAVWGSGPSDVYVATDKGLLHYDGATWTAQTDGVLGRGPWYGLWGSGPEDVYVVGRAGQILHHP